MGVVIGALALVLVIAALMPAIGKAARVLQRKARAFAQIPKGRRGADRWRELEQEVPSREVNVLMLGFAGSGKTLMLAGLFDRFRFGAALTAPAVDAAAVLANRRCLALRWNHSTKSRTSADVALSHAMSTAARKRHQRCRSYA
jgi:hypothetical protein